MLPTTTKRHRLARLASIACLAVPTAAVDSIYALAFHARPEAAILAIPIVLTGIAAAICVAIWRD